MFKIKYITQGWSPSMLTDLDVLIVQKEISLTEFQARSYTAKSLVGHRDLARCLGIEYAPSNNIRINPNDVILSIITLGGKLPKSFNSLQDIPEGITIAFVCMQIIKN